jgi:hypothetical protein
MQLFIMCHLSNAGQLRVSLFPVCEAPAPTTTDSIEAIEIDSLTVEQQAEAEPEELDNLEMQYIVIQMEQEDDADNDAYENDIAESLENTNGSLNDPLDDDDDDDDDGVDADL